MFAHTGKLAALILAAGLVPALASAESINPAGEKLYKTACVACHMAGVAGAPKLGDKTAWTKVMDKGMDAVMHITINGKGAMPPRGASKADDDTLLATVEYMLAKSK